MELAAATTLGDGPRDGGSKARVAPPAGASWYGMRQLVQNPIRVGGNGVPQCGHASAMTDLRLATPRLTQFSCNNQWSWTVRFIGLGAVGIVPGGGPRQQRLNHVAEIGARGRLVD